MNGEQRPYWLYYNEMDYIISHFPGHRPRINIDTGNSATAVATTNTTNASMDAANNSAANTEFVDIKPVRAASLSAINLEGSKYS